MLFRSFMANTWITAKKETLELLESIGEDKINDRVLLIDLIGRNTKILITEPLIINQIIRTQR